MNSIIHKYSGNKLSKDKRHSNKVYWLFAIMLYITFHLLTLTVSPLPWLDETFMASITDSLISENTYKVKYAAFTQQSEFLLYGPVYFQLQKGILKLIGFGIFQFRLLNFVCGLFSVFFIYKLVKSQLSKPTVLFIILAILLEPVFARNLHSGRMDFLALLLLLSSYISYTSINTTTKYKLLLSITTGILLALAMLTTPRIFFGFFFFVFQFFSTAKNRQKLFQHIVIAITFLLLYALWIYTKFNNINSFINIYYNNEVIKEHLGADTLNIIRYKYHYLVWLVLLASFVVLFLHRKVLSKDAKTILTISIINIIAFHLIVAERGPYASMITPFYFIVIGFGLDILMKKNRKLRWNIILYTTIILPFSLIFLVKLLVVSMSYKDRKSSSVDKQISKIIPPKSNVVGTFDYYYILHENNISFEEMEYYTDIDKMYVYHTSIFKYQYLIMRDNFVDSDITKYYFAKNKFKLVASIGNNRELTPFEAKVDEILFRYFDTHFLSSYGGKIYQKLN